VRPRCAPARPLALLLSLLGPAACHRPEPEPPPRVERVEPSGLAVPTALAEASVEFSAPVAPEGLVDRRLLALVPAAAERAAVKAVESAEGAAGLAEAVAGPVSLADGGRRVVLRPAGPLHPLLEYALVLGPGVRSADGGAVMDAEGRRRTTVARFQTAAAPGPAARPVIGQVRVDAGSPEAGGEYLVLVNRGEGRLDLYGLRLEKRAAGGGTSGCALGEGDVLPGGLALVVGGAYDQRYEVPSGTVVAPCGTSSLLGGLANDRMPVLRLLDPAGAELSSAGAAGGPACAILLRSDLDGPDVPENWECIDSD
jgi:hypothetical protein